MQDKHQQKLGELCKTCEDTETGLPTGLVVITFGSGARTTLPLSQAAVDYYRGIGVEVQ